MDVGPSVVCPHIFVNKVLLKLKTIRQYFDIGPTSDLFFLIRFVFYRPQNIEWNLHIKLTLEVSISNCLKIGPDIA